MSTNLSESLMRVVKERNERNDEQEFQQFCQYLLSLPADLEIAPRDNFKADIELQPLRSPVGNFHFTRWNCRGAGPPYIPEWVASPRNIDCASIAVAAQTVTSETTIPEPPFVILRVSKQAEFQLHPAGLRL